MPKSKKINKPAGKKPAGRKKQETKPKKAGKKPAKKETFKRKKSLGNKANVKIKNTNSTKVVFEEKDLVTVVIKDHYDSNGGHPHAIMDDIDDKHVSVGLTTKVKKGKNSTNKKLKKDPLDSGELSHMRRQATVDKKRNYTNERSGTMVKSDHEIAKKYAEKAKIKYMQKNSKEQ